MAPSTESPKKEETSGGEAESGGDKWKKVIPKVQDEAGEGAEGGVEEAQMNIMKLIKQRNYIRRLATKIRKIFIPNSLDRYMKLSKIATKWKAIKFPFFPGRLTGISKAKKVARFWKPQKRPSQTVQEIQNVFLIQKFARTWKRDWLKKKFAAIFPKNFIQVVKFKTIVNKWKGTSLKRALTQVYRVLAARIRIKKWKKKKKKPEPQMSIHSIIYLRRQMGKWAAAQRRLKLPKSLVGIISFKQNVNTWQKTTRKRIANYAKILLPRSILNIFNLKKKAKTWRKFAGVPSGIRQATKIGMGVSGFGESNKRDQDKRDNLERKDSTLSSASKTGGDFTTIDDHKTTSGHDRKQSKAHESGDGKSGLERRESSMSSSGRGDEKSGGFEKTSEEITEETGDSVSVGTLGQDGGKNGHQGDRKGQGATGSRGSVSGQQSATTFDGKTAKSSDQVKVKVIKSEKELRAERYTSLKKDIAEAEKLLEKSKELKEKAEKEIDKIKPFYIAALEDSKLSPKLILWIKSIRFNPPEAIRILMEAICVLKGIKPYVKYDKTTKTIMFVDYWVPSKKLLGGDFAKELKVLRKVGTHKMQYLKEFVGYVLTNQDFDREKIVLYDWIMSIYDFGTVSIKYDKRFKKLKEAEDMYYKNLHVIKRGKHEMTKIDRAIEREEKYQNKNHYTTKLTLLPSQQSYTFTVTGSSKRRYEYDFIKKKK